jgi:hypothetical protein
MHRSAQGADGRAGLDDPPASSADQDPRARQEGGGASPPELIEYVLHLCDIILVMTVNPRFGGQALPEMLPKIRRISRLMELKT